jgi:hypothetical protein
VADRLDSLLDRQRELHNLPDGAQQIRRHIYPCCRRTRTVQLGTGTRSIWTAKLASASIL